MQKEIKQFASVISGYTFRGAITPDQNGQTFVFQAKNIVTNESVDDHTVLTAVNLKQSNSDSYLKNGDVLIVSRGLGLGSFRATIFKSNKENVIASSSVHIIRLTSKDIIPEYLSAYLNSVDGQTKISQLVSGSHFKTLLRKNLQNLIVDIQPLEKQKIIVELQNNIYQQEKLISQKNKIQKNILNAIFSKITT